MSLKNAKDMQVLNIVKESVIRNIKNKHLLYYVVDCL